MDHPYIFTTKEIILEVSFFSQVNAEASAASADAQEERACDEVQEDAPQPLQPARADDNSPDAWTNHPGVAERDN